MVGCGLLRAWLVFVEGDGVAIQGVDGWLWLVEGDGVAIRGLVRRDPGRGLRARGQDAQLGVRDGANT